MKTAPSAPRRPARRFPASLAPASLALAFSAMALITAPGPALAAKKARTKAAPAAVEEKPVAPPSPQAALVADWIAASGDNQSLPYIVIDKQAARLHVFDAKGKAVAEGPVLLGIASGDEASPGIGSKNLSEIGPAEKTTPAGRFLAKFGVAAGNQRVLWVDYATSVAIHTIPSGNPKERRRERMLSPAIDDNRITFGCINVPKAIYGRQITPLFRRKGGYVYVMPDEKPLEEVFPRIRVHMVQPAS
jgi:hypothetical protein|nr:L,D-transpeptidase [Novosphingobium silvae]